jgi:2-polyprenyl-6-methoxyphenol hydroxylase-like FAD-dependent oxidoreductase
MKGIIIGGGIGGLTTAIALRKKGIEVKIYEQSSEIAAAGAGLWVASNALSVLDRLGLADEVVAAGHEFTAVEITDTKDKVISSIDCVKVKEKFGKGNFAIHRGALQSVLLENVPSETIFTNKVFEKYTQNDQGVTAFFTDGTSETADFMIAADGIHSKVRQQFLPNQKLRFAEQTCWRFVIDWQLPNHRKAQEIWGNGKGVRVGFSQINSQQVYCYITKKETAGGKDDKNNIKENLLRLCADFQPIVQEIIQRLDVEKILRNDIYDLAPHSNWQDRKIVLLGDAAHATTPNMGQGACQAIEDAYVIVECLAKNENVETAFAQYQKSRIEKANYVVNTSWMIGKLTNTSGFLKKIIVFLMEMTPNSVNEKQFGKIYKIE